MKVALKYVPVSLVDFNEGQLEGVPANPRTREDSRQEKLAESIEELPEMSEARPPMVLPRDGRYIVIGGNRRLEAFRDLNREEMPVVVLPEDTPVEKLRRIVLLDNESTGETDWEAVMKNWKADELESWGIDVPRIFDNQDDFNLDNFFNKESNQSSLETKITIIIPEDYESDEVEKIKEELSKLLENYNGVKIA